MIAMTSVNRRTQSGVTLVELMIALVLGLLVILGLVTLMNSIGITNRVQDGMARVQENGRYALLRISEDLRAASSQYCSNFGSGTGQLGTGGGVTAEYYLEGVRPFASHFDAGTRLNFGPIVSAPPAIGTGVPPTGQSQGNRYLISPRWMLFGSECATGSCTPAVNAANRGIDPAVFAGTRATMGINAGNRARGADSLSIRYIRGPGVRVTGSSASGTLPAGPPIVVNADTAALGIVDTTIANVLVTDCAIAEMIRMQATGGTLVATGNHSDSVWPGLRADSDARAYNLDRDFIQVSYFLQVKDDPDPNRVPVNRKIVVLMRSENGVAEEIVEGVERLDFMYGVNDVLGRTRYLTAAQVDAMGVDCPPSTAIYNGWIQNYFGTPEPGCGWKAVKTVEVSLLLNTVTDSAVTNAEPFRYSWTNSGAVNAANTYENPAALGTLLNGLPPYRMLRREFRTQVAVRGYNY